MKKEDNTALYMVLALICFIFIIGASFYIVYNIRLQSYAATKFCVKQGYDDFNEMKLLYDNDYGIECINDFNEKKIFINVEYKLKCYEFDKYFSCIKERWIFEK